jgi:hypothetical protein
MNTTVKAISSLGVRRQKKVLAEIDFAAAYLASLHAVVRERRSQVS